MELETQKLALEQQAVELEMQNEDLRVTRQLAEAARDHYRQLYESAPIGYFTLDGDGRITDLNAAAAVLMTCGPKQLLGRRFVDFITQEQHPAFQKFLADLAADDGEAGSMLVRIDDGQLILRLDGGLHLSAHEFLLAASDETARWRNETALAAARDLAEEGSRAKSAFLANMSHEMRTPLHIIVGLAHLLRRDLMDALQHQRLEQLCANSDHLLDLINDVLDLSRIEASRLALEQRPFRLAHVLDRVLGVIATPAKTKGLALSVEVAPEVVEAQLVGDPLRLAQVLINLASNAVKFTERGSIRLCVEVLEDSDDGLALRFAVQDTGIGIAECDQAHLFEPFRQADNSLARSHGGSGLGLAISQRLVGMMGGRIEAQSQPGKGSRFGFELRLGRATAAAVEAPAVPNGAGFEGRHILFAEDHPLSQEILFEMLEDLGCEVEAAADGHEALECARARRYDLILMDMQMPHLDGLSATQAIRQLEHHQRTPIVALTANAFAEDRQRCLAAGMNDHLGKPVTPESLAAALGRWLPTDAADDPVRTATRKREDARTSDAAALQAPAAMRGSLQRRTEYRALVRRFLALHGRDPARLEAHLARQEQDEAHKLAHDLKGIAGLVGARRLASAADDIVAALRRGDGVDALQPLVSACAAELEAVAALAASWPATPE